MEVEIILPIETSIDLKLNTNNNTYSSTPYISAHSSPQQLNTNFFFYSAPNSPNNNNFLSIPFHWEQTPGIPKIQTLKNADQDFEFDFIGLKTSVSAVSADELFDQGRIKPLKPPPRFDTDLERDLRSPILKGRKKRAMIKDAFSPRGRRKDFDPFEAALKETTTTTTTRQQRGRKSKFVRRITRSLSPFRFSDVSCGQGQEKEKILESTVEAKASSSFSFLRAYRKLKLGDLLLFRSSSEKMKKFETLSKTIR